MLQDSKEAQGLSSAAISEPATLEEITASDLLPTQIQPRVAIMCPTHKMPFTQIEIQTQRPVCEECLAQMNTIDIECERVKATNRFRQQQQGQYRFVDEFRLENEELEKMKGLFKASGISDVRRKIKKGLPHMQQLLIQKIKNLVDQGNRELEEQIAKELEPWKFLDDEVVSDPVNMPKMLQYKTIFAEQRGRINALKIDIKERIAETIKQIVRKYYLEQFDLE